MPQNLDLSFFHKDFFLNKKNNKEKYFVSKIVKIILNLVVPT